MATGRSARGGTMSSVSDSDEERGVAGGLAGGDLDGKIPDVRLMDSFLFFSFFFLIRALWSHFKVSSKLRNACETFFILLVLCVEVTTFFSLSPKFYYFKWILDTAVDLAATHDQSHKSWSAEQNKLIIYRSHTHTHTHTHTHSCGGGGGGGGVCQ